MRLHHMAPARSVCYATDVSALNAEIVGNELMYFARLSATANLTYDVVSDRCGMMPFALLAAMLTLICIIVDWCAPVKVFKPVVCGDAVTMASFTSCWSRANENLQYQMMYVPEVAPAKINHCSSVILRLFALDEARFQLSPVVTHTPAVVATTPNRAVISDPISRMSIHNSI